MDWGPLRWAGIAPCVLWVDEIEKALFGSGDTSGVSQGILGDLLYAI